MAYKALTTVRLGLPYFPTGVFYSAEADRRRFLYLDYNLKSYLGIVGNGIIEGWEISDAGGLNITIAYGTALISGLFSESPFTVKEHSTVLPSDYVITEDYYTDVAAWTQDTKFYDTEIGQTVPPNPTSSTVYDKVLYSVPFALTNNSDNYIYVYRNGVDSISYPYYAPNNVAPIPESIAGRNPLYTAVAFGKTGSLSLAQSSGKAFIGKVVTRDGVITKIDTSKVNPLKNLYSTIVSFGQKLVYEHRHGGTGDYDPDKIVLRTDTRDCALESAKEDYVTYKILYSEPTSVSVGHKHFYSVDSDGNGLTVTQVGSGVFHFHNISSFVVESSIVEEDSIAKHTHTITLSSTSPDTWTTVEDYQIYINSEPYYGINASVSAEDKTITFTDDITITKRKYIVNKTFSDGSTYTFESEEPSIFRFMLRLSLDYYAKNSDAISNGTKQSLILPDPASPVTLLKNQCMVAEQQLSETGDTFTFVGLVAPDPVTVTLLEPGHVDKVGIEIVSNSEVSGKLRAQNILYIPAEKFTSGEFSIGVIPVLSHMGRYLEECYFDQVRATSYDGYVYESFGYTPWGNGKIVYASHIDSSQNIVVATSDGLYRYPVNGAYLFVVNGEKIIVQYGDLQDALYFALRQYYSKTGDKISIKKELYDPQIVTAEIQLSGYGTYYKITGDSRIVDGEVIYNTINIFRIEGYKIPEFGYQIVRLENEILEGEEIIEEIKSETGQTLGSSEETVQETRMFLVKNDFNKSTVKNLVVETNYVDQYGGLDKMYFAVASDYIAKTPDPDSEWNIVYQSSFLGYINGVYRTYNGYYGAFTSSGLYVCTSITSSEYKPVNLPDSDSVILASTFGFGDRILMSYGSSVAVTDDYGETWQISSLSSSPAIKFLFDPTMDRTDITNLHYHDFDFNYAGNGYTDSVYNFLGVEIAKDHVHAVAGGVVQEIDGHTHGSIRTFYVLNEMNEIYESEDGFTWTKYADIPTSYGEIGDVSTCFGKIIVCVEEGIIYTLDGVTWTKFSIFEGPVFSSQWDDNNLKIYFGGMNYLYSYNGTDFEIVKTFEGCGVPSVYVDDSRKFFNYTVNNYSRKVDFIGRNQTENIIDTVFDFNKCYTLHGAWSAGVDYDFYINDLLVRSTRDDVIITGENIKATVSNEGYIDFGVLSALKNDVSYGDDYVDVVDGTEFPATGYIKLNWDGEFAKECVFYKYSSKSANRLYIDDPSEYEILVTKVTTDSTGKKTTETIEVAVELISGLGVSDNILITIYEGKLANVGKNTHEDVEDALSYKNIGSPKTFADVYLSNLMHFTVALKYAISDVGDDYKNYFLSLFDYNDTPGDEHNIDRFIDRYASDFFSQVMYSNDFIPEKSFKINRIIFGFGTFDNLLFVATNIGLYVSKINLGYEANWFRVDVDSSLSANDVLQAKDELLFICTEKGLYQTESSTLTVWTQFVEDVVGGIPTKINPRWESISSYNNDESYWWQGWQGVTHDNSSLVNSLFVSGNGFCSVTDNYGTTWQKGYITTSDGTLVRTSYFLSDVAILHNGTSVRCLKNILTKRSSVIQTTGNGSNWSEIYGFSLYSGRIIGYSVTDYNNVLLSVTYDINQPYSGKLRGLNLLCDGKEFIVIENSTGKVTVYGLDIINSLSGNDTFSVEPANLNAISELPDGTISIGSSNGVLTDRGVFLSGSGKSAGVVKGVGYRAVVSSLNIKGKIVSVIFSNSERTMISATLTPSVKSNNLVGYKLKFSGLTDMEVVSNDETKADGTTVIVTKCDWNAIPLGLIFSAVSTNNRLFVEYDSLLKYGELTGGKLYTLQDSGGTTSESKNIPGFNIVSNTQDFIEIVNDGTTTNFDWEELFPNGTVVFATTSSKTIPIFVDFVEIPQIDSLKGNYAVFDNVSENISKFSVLISGNTENIVYVPHEFVAQFKNINNAYQTGTFITYSCIFNGDSFSLRDASFESDNAFNLKSTAVVSDHYHSISVYGKTLEGTVSSIGTNTEVYVDLNIYTCADLAASPFLGRPTLLEGSEIVLFNPDDYSTTYRVEVITAESTKIRAKKDGDIFNISGAEPKKISAGFTFLIGANLYGLTDSTSYTSDFIVKRAYLTSTTYVNGKTFNVTSTSGMFVGNSVAIKDRNGLVFKTKISSIPNLISFVVEDESPFDFKTTKDSYYELYYGSVEIGTFILTFNSSWNAYSIKIADTSSILSEDTIILLDDKGQMFISIVDIIVSPTELTVEDKINSDYTVANGSYIVVERNNFSENHTHLIENGEFQKIENSDWQKCGYAFSHGHSISPFIKDILDIETIHGKVYVCGNSSKVYMSNNSGYSWSKEVDLAEIGEISPTPTKVQIMSTDGKDILFGSDTGSIVYHSTLVPTSIVPLEKPV